MTICLVSLLQDENVNFYNENLMTNISGSDVYLLSKDCVKQVDHGIYFFLCIKNTTFLYLIWHILIVC